MSNVSYIIKVRALYNNPKKQITFCRSQKELKRFLTKIDYNRFEIISIKELEGGLQPNSSYYFKNDNNLELGV